MIAFDAEHKSVHYPEDRRFRIWIRPSILAGFGTDLELIASRKFRSFESFDASAPDRFARAWRRGRASALPANGAKDQRLDEEGNW
jgi:hypothetical protein